MMSTLVAGSLSTSKPDTSSLPSFSAANGYSSSTYSSHSAHSQSHKSVSSASQTYSHTAVSQTSAAAYPSQYSSQTQYSGGQQNQFASTAQPQFPGTQSQFPAAGSAGTSAPAPAPNQYLSGQTQYPSGNQGSFPSAPVVTQNQYQTGAGQFHSNYQSSSASFQSQPASQSPHNSLYPNTTQQSGSSYPSGSASFHVRDSQPGGNLQQSVVSQPSNTYQSQPPAPGLSKATTTQSPSAYNTQTYSAQHASQHAQNLQASPLSNKLGDSLSKMALKDTTTLDSRSSQVSFLTMSMCVCVCVCV